MQKKLLFSAMLIACFAFAATAQYQRRVLVEEFTNASCGPCAGQNPAFNAKLDARADIVTPIKYQTNWPGTDPMNTQTQAEVAPRVTYYGVTGVPHGVVNGTSIPNDCNGYIGAPACLSLAEIDAAYAETTPVDMSVSYTFSPNADSLNINVSVTSDVALTGTLRLHVAVVEDAIYFASAPGSNGEREFFQVMRKMVPNANGTTIASFTAGETKTYAFKIRIPTYIYNKNQLGVSAWLQDNVDKKVHQSARAVPPTPKVLVNSASSFICAPATPVVTFTNIAADPLTSAKIRYRVGTNPWAEYDWTGNVPAGGSAQVSLPNTEVTQAGVNKLDVLVIESNNGASQLDINAGFSTITTKGFFGPGIALPSGSDFQGATFPPTNWDLGNLGTNGWRVATTGFNSTRSAMNNFYAYDSGNTTMMAAKVDLSNLTSTTALTFDHAYTHYVSGADLFFDSLRIEVTTDCGATWNTVFHDGYEGLGTAPPVASSFVPTAAQWRANSVDLSAFNGNSEVFVRFVGETGYGNNLYIDNVNISTVSGVKPLELSAFSLSPNPSNGISEVRFELPTAQNMQLMVYNALGSLVQSRDLGFLTSGQHNVSVDAARLNAGSYRVVLQGAAGIAQTQWIVLK